MGKKNVYVNICTPYLTGKVLERHQDDPNELDEQIKKYGAVNNFGDVKTLETKRHKVVIDLRDFRLDLDRSLLDAIARTHLVVHGSTRVAEVDTRILGPAGVLVARCSIFYGGPSKYSGSLPEDGGYSIDVPKDAETLKQLLTYDPFLDGVRARDASRIRSALEALNRRLKEPVYATSFLDKAAAIPRKKVAQNIRKRKPRWEELRESAIDEIVLELPVHLISQ